ncbi:hypothetical protein AAHC03_05578 [Spirometra sp. Aus1]
MQGMPAFPRSVSPTEEHVSAPPTPYAMKLFTSAWHIGCGHSAPVKYGWFQTVFVVPLSSGVFTAVRRLRGKSPSACAVVVDCGGWDNGHLKLCVHGRAYAHRHDRHESGRITSVLHSAVVLSKASDRLLLASPLLVQSRYLFCKSFQSRLFRFKLPTLLIFMGSAVYVICGA